MSDPTQRAIGPENLHHWTADIVVAYAKANPIAATDLASVISAVGKALIQLTKHETSKPDNPLAPAVAIEKSARANHLVCLEDGLTFKQLKRHLRSQHGMTPAHYRAKWGLPGSYPITAPALISAKSVTAKARGLGKHSRDVGRPRKG
jgi:predicted transcriptional regulator